MPKPELPATKTAQWSDVSAAVEKADAARVMVESILFWRRSGEGRERHGKAEMPRDVALAPCLHYRPK